jgi:hypothetical protein
MATTDKIIYTRTNVLATDVALAASAGDVTGLSIPVEAGLTYRFKFVITFNADATTSGSGFSLNGPAASTYVSYKAWNAESTASPAQSPMSVDGFSSTPSAGSANPYTTGNRAEFEGVVTPSVNGTLQIRGIKETGTITVKAGVSYIEWSRIDWPAAS